MITPSQIKQKALNLYPAFVKDWLAGQGQFPRRIPADLKLPKDRDTAKRETIALREASKQFCERGYTVIWKRIDKRELGKNDFADAIQIDTEEDLVHLAGKRREFSTLKRTVKLLRLKQPRLESWLQESMHWKLLMGVDKDLEHLLAVIQYTIDHPRPGCYVRELPLPISTKLINDHKRLLSDWLTRLLPPEAINSRYRHDDFELRYGFRKTPHHVLVRILDRDLQSELKIRFSEMSLPLETINDLKPPNVNVFIVENKVNLLTLPSIARGIAIGGLGRAVSVLKHASWLSTSNLFYWGDLDIEGFQILSHFRNLFPNSHSLLMDVGALRAHLHLAQPWRGKPNSSPLNLTEPERTAHNYLLEHRLRIEQEHIPQATVLSALEALSKH